MSTNALISVMTKNSHNEDIYKTIYCHWDGYLSHLGAILFKNYNTAELADALVSLGDASCIEEKLTPTGEHSFDKPENGVCVFYHRDRGEDWGNTKPRELWAVEFRKDNKFVYTYLFKDNAWHYKKPDGQRFCKLTENMFSDD